ncbi:MAG: alkaline phosphatase family protein [Chthoniobacteraceae bacterium]
MPDKPSPTSPRHLGFRIATALVVLCIFVTTTRAAEAPRPKLIVAILVDQLRYDYLERFHDQFIEDGLRLLTDDGVNMTFAHYDYCPTVTGPGHASVFSGAPPAMHGIIGNDWFDKRTGKSMYCCADSTVTGVGADPKSGRMSPRNFIGDNFADELRMRFGSKVVGISMKDRGAILPAGKKPAGAYWIEPKGGNFVTSSYYMAELPAWVRDFNQRGLAASFLGQTWDRLLDEESYERADDAAGEGNLSGEKKPVFPHVIARPKPSTDASGKPEAPDCENIFPTPFSNQVLAEFARAAIEGEQLGAGAGPDLLTVSFSAIDTCGHRFGPYSQEVQDITLRLDRQLAELFTYLDRKFGLANVIITLTADHAVMPTPEFAAEQGLDGQRVDEVPLMSDLRAKMSERFGSASLLLSKRFYNGNLYFNHDALRDKQIAPADLASFIREWALDTGKFQACYSREQLLDGRTPGPIGQRVFHGYNAERSGDVVLVYKPFIIPGTDKTGTTHGSPYSYDTQVPVLFHGAAFKPGRYADEFNITDIVPTLCAALGMNEPAGSIGKPFIKALEGEGPTGRNAGSTGESTVTSAR